MLATKNMFRVFYYEHAFFLFSVICKGRFFQKTVIFDAILGFTPQRAVRVLAAGIF